MHTGQCTGRVPPCNPQPKWTRGWKGCAALRQEEGGGRRFSTTRKGPERPYRHPHTFPRGTCQGAAVDTRHSEGRCQRGSHSLQTTLTAAGGWGRCPAAALQTSGQSLVQCCVSSVQQSDSVIYTHMCIYANIFFFKILILYRLLQDPE